MLSSSSSLSLSLSSSLSHLLFRNLVVVVVVATFCGIITQNYYCHHHHVVVTAFSSTTTTTLFRHYNNDGRGRGRLMKHYRSSDRLMTMTMMMMMASQDDDDNENNNNDDDYWSTIIKTELFKDMFVDDDASQQQQRRHLPKSIDSVLDPTKPIFSSNRPTLFRERHGWCPYSERCWLALELTGITYDTVRIDNTGHGPRPSYYSGQTPQILWEDGSKQGESMDIVNEIDQRYANGKYLSDSSYVQDIVKEFTNIFPRARPSSRAAYLFQYNGEPLWKSTFEQTLQDTDDLLRQAKDDGPYFCGSKLTVADIAWVPFLERYRYQLPCLHDGLDPYNHIKYPNLARWYDAMDTIPVYSCRVKGDASSWRKVLTMSGFGNSGNIPPQIQSNMNDLISKEEYISKHKCIDLDCWTEYVSTRRPSYAVAASTPYLEAASIIIKNRDAIVTDIVKQSAGGGYIMSSSSAYNNNKNNYNNNNNKGLLLLPTSIEEADCALQELTQLLIDMNNDNNDHDNQTTTTSSDSASVIATFLDERMCVPRDMGAMTAATIKNLSVALRR